MKFERHFTDVTLVSEDVMVMVMVIVMVMVMVMV